MMRSIIVDDEPKNIRVLKKIINEYCPDVEVVAEAKDAHQAIAAIKDYEPDLVFLDIEMPYGNAFEILDKLMPVNFEVIFITAFDEYAVKAFRYSALDYLLKPINIQELQAAVQKALSNFGKKNVGLQLKNLMDNLQSKNETLRKIAFPSKEGMIFVPMGDIIRCEASGSYTYIFIKGGDKIISSKSVKEYEELLPEAIFFRIHHSHIINLTEVKKYHRGRGGEVEMSDGALIDVAVRRKEEFLSRYQ